MREGRYPAVAGRSEWNLHRGVRRSIYGGLTALNNAQSARQYDSKFGRRRMAKGW